VSTNWHGARRRFLPCGTRQPARDPRTSYGARGRPAEVAAIATRAADVRAYLHAELLKTNRA